MKILTISDTHGLHKRIPKDWLIPADTIAHAGDCTNRGLGMEVYDFLKWYDSLDYKNKLLIAGNHDFLFQEEPEKVKEMLAEFPGITYLEDSSVVIDGLKFYGSPQTPYFHNWAFNCARNIDDALTYSKPLIRAYWDAIDEDTDVLITHGPPNGLNDFVPYGNGDNVGCADLLDTIHNRLNIKVNIHGHIHYSYGEVIANNVNFINAAVVNEQYEITNKPILIEI